MESLYRFVVVSGVQTSSIFPVSDSLVAGELALGLEEVVGLLADLH